MVDVTVGVVVVADVGRGAAVDEGLRSQGFGGDACMSKDWGRRHRQTPIEQFQSHMICDVSCECLRYMHLKRGM